MQTFLKLNFEQFIESMSSPAAFRLRSFYIRALSWEYWPMWLVHFPVSFYYIYLALKARSFFFFSASNPSIETGGMFFESKWDIFKLIPEQYYPPTILVKEEDDLEVISGKMKHAGIEFPVIAKPNRGERGWGVRKITSCNELAIYKNAAAVDFLLQTYVDYPLEFSIFYYRNPASEKGRLTSVTLKKLLSITGDGCATVEELIRRNDRSFLQYNKLKESKQLDFARILKAGEQEILVPYGNHVLGAMFVDYTHIIDERLVATFDHLSKQINGFFYGRFDLRCSSVEDMKAGKNISILELNGAGAEPAHIYDPHFSFFKAQKVIAEHYGMMYRAALANHQAGVPFMSLRSYIRARKLEKKYKQNLQLI
jgi:hypothetical protein